MWLVVELESGWIWVGDRVESYRYMMVFEVVVEDGVIWGEVYRMRR